MNNRRKGIRIEQIYAKRFRDEGFVDCITSREGSKYYDDAGVDFLNLPVLVQCKAGYAKGINYVTLLETLGIKKRKLPKHEHNKPTCILHIKDVGKGRKRQPEHNLIVMTLDDFFKLLKCKNTEDILDGTNPV
jgi:hypothetical protein